MSTIYKPHLIMKKKKNFSVIIFSFYLILISGNILGQTDNPKKETRDEYINRLAEKYEAQKRQSEVHEQFVKDQETDFQREQRDRLFRVKEEQQEEIDRQRGYHKFNRDNEPSKEDKKQKEEMRKYREACKEGAISGAAGGAVAGAPGGLKGIAVGTVAGAAGGCTAKMVERKIKQGKSKNCSREKRYNKRFKTNTNL